MNNIIYLASVFSFSIGLYICIANENYIKKLIGLSIFQNSVLIFYIAMGKLREGIVPIAVCDNCNVVYSSPIPHVLMLTAIVVGLATLSVGLAISIRIQNEFKSTNEKIVESIKQ